MIRPPSQRRPTAGVRPAHYRCNRALAAFSVRLRSLRSSVLNPVTSVSSASLSPPLTFLGEHSRIGRSLRNPMSPTTALSLLQGTADLLILRALQGGAAHGYAISRWVRERTDGVLAIEDAALYQALHRLEARGWIEAEWGLSENNRKAKVPTASPRPAGSRSGARSRSGRGTPKRSSRSSNPPDADGTSNSATTRETALRLRRAVE